MRPVIFLTKRIIYPQRYIRAQYYLMELHNKVKFNEGFISAETYWNRNYDQELITISKWESSKDFKEWMESLERIRIRDEYQDVVINEQSDEMYKMINNTGFLL